MKRKADRKLLEFNHLSWSKMTAIERGEDVFIERYIEAIPIRSRYIDFGKFFAECAEEGKSKDFIVDAIVKSLPKGEPEKEFVVEYEKIKILGYFDRYDKKENTIWEFKTGTKLWTDRTLQECGQTKLYSFMYWLRYGIIPTIGLYSVETEYDEDFEEMRATGRTRKLITQYQKKDMFLMAKRVVDDYKKIIKVLKSYEQ